LRECRSEEQTYLLASINPQTPMLIPSGGVLVGVRGFSG